GLRHPAHELLPLPAVADEVGDRHHHQTMLGREAFEVGEAGHGARRVVVDDLAQDGGRVEAGQAGEVDAGLGVAGPLEDAAVPVAEGEDVARPVEVVGAGVAVDQGLDGGGPVGGGEAGAGADLWSGADGSGWPSVVRRSSGARRTWPPGRPPGSPERPDLWSRGWSR